MKQYKILVVDDEINICKLLEVSFKKIGYEVVTSLSGEEALRIVNEQTIDLIILDIMMPGIDGIEVLKRLKKNPHTKDIPVVMLTVKREDKDIFKGWQEGAEAYLTKPFDVKEVIVMVKGILRDLEIYGKK